MRAIWRGTVSFGLVNIPVKLYTATEDKDVHFNQLHRQCNTPIRYRRFCPTCNQEVERDDIVRGYEYTVGQYVLVEDEELEKLPSQAERSVEILDFVDLAQIDPIYFVKSYYLEPSEGGGKAYALLRQAMQETRRIALAKFTLRSKQRLAAIRVYDENVLSLATMLFPDEIRSYQQLDLSHLPVEVGERELAIACDLIDRLSVEFNPDQYKDVYREELLELIEAKAEGREALKTPPAQQPQVIDLMEALQKSVEQLKKEPGNRPAGRNMQRAGSVR